MAVRMIHIGRKAPKGFRELPGASHMGGGLWVIPVEPDPNYVPSKREARRSTSAGQQTEAESK
jgi:hypothetical protein